MKLAKALSVMLPLLAAVAPSLATAQHADNPFVGAKMYVNPDYTANAAAQAALQSDATFKANIMKVGNSPTAVWFDRIAAVPNLATHLDQTLAQGANLFLGVVYDLPGRDCHALASNGELPPTEAGLTRYKTEYIDGLVAIASQSKYAGIKIVFVVEPDSLPNLVTNMSDADCAAAAATQSWAPDGFYRTGIRYAVNKLHALSNVYLYIDAGHSGWLGWPENFTGWTAEMTKLASGFTAGKSAIEGLVDDTANTLPLKEPFIASGMSIGGSEMRMAKFYDWDPYVDEQGYIGALYTAFVGAGWPSSFGILHDSSRNGWGGSARPTKASSSTVLDTYVAESKVDKRAHRGLWCNPLGAGVGYRPEAAPSGYSSQHIDAFVWVKPPGESDGASKEIPNDQGKGFDRMCDPTFMTQYNVLTGATPDAPLSGDFFAAQFLTLVRNAYPPLDATGPTCTGIPSGPTTINATGVSGGQIDVTWSTSIPPSGCSLTYSVHASTTNSFTPSASTLKVSGLSATTTSYSITGLNPNTTYFVMVQAVDELGAAGSPYKQTNTTNGYVLTVTKTGSGSGTVTGGGINCGSSCSVVTNPSTLVTLTATAASGSSFTGWSGDCSGTSTTCSVNMSQSRTVSAVFGGTTTSYTLTVAKSGVGAGTVSGGGISCGSTCSASFTAGTTVTLTAAAVSGSTFGGWSGACSGTGTCAVTMSQAQSVTAAFNSNVTNYTLTVTKSGTGSGTVSGGSISCGSTCSVQAASGTTITLNAAAASGSTFSGWGGSCTGTGSCIVTLTANAAVTASFTANGTTQTPVSVNGRLRVCGTHICNASGAQVQLKGMSLFWSNTGWGAERFFNAQAVQNLYTTWGATVVRAPLGVEGGGSYVVSNDSLNPVDAAGNLARITTVVDAAISTGIYVIVDWHYSSATIYQSQAQTFFQMMAQKYAASPNVIWETYNEPTSLNWSSQLKPYHTAVISSIRSAGSQNLVVAGTPTWSQDVDAASLDKLSDTNTAYTLHFYAGSHTSWLRSKGDTAMSNGAALFVTEWGTVDASGNGGYNASESTNWTTWMDQNKISSANWSLNDKAESASALVSGGSASATGPWSDSQLTQSGAYVKAYISANSQPTTFALAVTKSGTGSGTVTSSSGGISCGSTCSATYNSGTVVTLTAAAASGSTFAGWSGSCSGSSATCSVTMSAARSATATFNTVVTTTFSVSVTKSGTGSGTVTGASGAINCGSSCGTTVNAGTVVTLTAAAASGSTFAGWSGACSGTGVCAVTVNSNVSANATFNTVGTTTYTVSVAKAGTGSGTLSGSCASGCTVNAGSTVTLTASAASGSTFAGWSGPCTGTNATCSFTVNANTSVSAAFNIVSTTTYTVTVGKTGTGSGTISGSCASGCTVNAGSTVTLTAVAASGSTFAGWSGPCSGTNATCSFTVNANTSVSAAFNTQSSGGPCANPVTFTGNTNNFNTTGAVCYRTSATVNGWGCYNMDARTVSVNGTVLACGAGSVPLAKSSDGYTYFSATAGTYPWAGIYTW